MFCNVSRRLASMVLAAALTVVLVAGGATAQESAKTPATSDGGVKSQWQLPSFDLCTASHAPLPMTVDGKFAAVSVVEKLTQDDKIKGRTARYTTWLVDLTTGKYVEVIDLLGDDAKKKFPQVVSAAFSADGKCLAAVAVEPTTRAMSVWLVTLADKQAVSIAQGKMLMPVWVGSQLSLTQIDEGKALPIKLFDPANPNQPKELKITGAVASASPKGDFMVCACDEKNPAKAVTLAELQKSVPSVLVGLDGKVMKVLGTGMDVGTSPAFSPDGKLMAWQHNGWTKGDARSGPPDVIRVDVVSAVEDEKWSIAEHATPIFISNVGAVFALGGVFTETGTSVNLYDSRGKLVKKLVDGVWAASVVGGKLYYITGGEDKVLKTMDLPK